MAFFVAVAALACTMNASLPLITDPFFYLVAVPAVLLLGVSKSGFGAGFGSLAVPMMAMAVSVGEAAAILMPLLFVMDVLGMAAFRKDFDPVLLRRILPFGIAGIGLGALMFRLVPAPVVSATVGALTLLFLAQRLRPAKATDAPPPHWLGRILATASGFTSFVAHAGGPPINVYFIGLKLAPLRFTATMSFFFFALNLCKWLPYGYLGLLDLRNMSTALVLLPLAPVGVWLGVRLARRVSPQLFYRLVYVGMLLTGLKLLWDGLA